MSNGGPVAPRFSPANLLWLVIFMLILMYVFANRLTDNVGQVAISYTEFSQLLQEGKIRKVIFRAQTLQGELWAAQNLGQQNQPGKNFQTHIPSAAGETLIQRLEAQKVIIEVEPGEQSTWATILLSILPWLVFLGIWIWLIQKASRNIAGGMGGHSELKKFMEGSSETVITIPKVRFADVAGQENAKREVMELIEYLGNPDKFRKLGAEVPRGVLLMGPPGTGKTLMAKALAGEAGVPFASISASEFIEVFVGVGASRVRKLFQTAKSKAPSIIFIDELDSIGRTRGTGLGGGHDEREQTLNQILAEMDGFSGHEAVIVLAATNRPDVLDPALLRPGRFDRHVTLDLPDKADRMKILEVHSKKVPLADDVSFEVIANGTPGFSGADIKNLVNEAAIAASREDANQVYMKHFDEAKDKLMLGTVRTLAIQEEERHRLAVHESGHTLVAYFLDHTDPLYKVTIIPRGHALGVTHQLPEQERHTLPEDYLKAKLAILMGGRCAERFCLQTISSGADNDIREATSLARAMVERWGMAEAVGPMDLRQSSEHPFLGKDISQPRHFSEGSAKLVDKAVKELLYTAENTATELIELHRDKMDKLVSLLKQEETLHLSQIRDCLGYRVGKNDNIVEYPKPQSPR